MVHLFGDKNAWNAAMLQKCANPNCSSPFRKLSEGKLFLVERESSASSKPSLRRWDDGVPHRIEHFWLCSECASILTLAFEKGKGLTTVPLREMPKKKPAASVALSALSA
jgi:hypothetical protein